MKIKYGCQCEAPCIRKGKVRKIYIINKEGKKKKKKIQECNNASNSCTCRYRVPDYNAFQY